MPADTVGVPEEQGVRQRTSKGASGNRIGFYRVKDWLDRTWRYKGTCWFDPPALSAIAKSTYPRTPARAPTKGLPRIHAFKRRRAFPPPPRLCHGDRG